MPDLIIDVGSGYRPLPEATVLVDAYTDNRSRRADLLVLPHQTFVQADVRALPFGDKSAAYVHCSHTLEHVESDLERACDELMRVGRAGFVGVPNFTYDRGLSKPYHHWWCFITEDKEVVFAKRDIVDAVLVQLERMPEMLGGIELRWEESFRYSVIRSPDDFEAWQRSR